MPKKGRSGTYASDLAKTINAPIFHVNADSPEDVEHVFRVAARFRQRFNQDVVIDLIGYRKMGHNELDQPSFTQPLMYKQVAKMEPVARKYENQLIEQGVVTEKKVKEMKEFIHNTFEAAYMKSKGHKFEAEDWVTPQWEKIKELKVKEQIMSGIPIDRVRDTGKLISKLPEESEFHK